MSQLHATRMPIAGQLRPRKARRPRIYWESVAGVLLMVGGLLIALGLLVAEVPDQAALPVLAIALGLALYAPAIRRVERTEAAQR